MMVNFVRSLLSGKLFSNIDMKNKLDPIAVLKGWNKADDVSLPRIGAVVRDARDYTLPLTPNDRVYETIGSYAYREGVSFLPGQLNLLKRTLMMGNSPLGSITKFQGLLGAIASQGDEVKLGKVLDAMRGTVRVFNYLNDAELHRGFTAAGRTLTAEMRYANQYMPELKGILAAWQEWEKDYYDFVTSEALKWLTERGALVAQKFAGAGGLAENPAALKLISGAAQIMSQAGQIKSPLSS
ncbi:hypothetical protein F4808DRAFT_461010 [Astrocystis sublimbata]|nr:hypothetical protein F4808DRAFT_461010 [Astrocystis sublimbata]